MVKTTLGISHRWASQVSMLCRSVSGLGVLLSVVALSTSSVVGQQTDSDFGRASVARTFSAAEAAATLASLRAIADSTENIAIRTNRPDIAESVRWAREIIVEMSDEQLAIFADLQPSLGRLGEILRETEDLLLTINQDDDGPGDPQRMTPGAFPGGGYSGLCGMKRDGELSTGTVRGFLIAQQVVEGIAVLAKRGCSQTIAGVNITWPCIAADTIWLAAASVYEGLVFCVEDIDSAEIKGFYDRLGHIHGDLEAARIDGTSSIRTNKGLINDARNQILKALKAGLNSIGDAIGAMLKKVLNEIERLFIEQNEELRAWRIYRLQLWIEEDLGREMDEHRIGSFQLPDSFVCAAAIDDVPCGSLDTVEQIVKETIANMETAGMPTYGAQGLVEKARHLLSLAEYKEAYALFSIAYRLATATEEPARGACCHETGSCVDDLLSVECVGSDNTWHEALSCEELGDPCKDPSGANAPTWSERGSASGTRQNGGRAEGR